jgi:hypothetical protein
MAGGGSAGVSAGVSSSAGGEDDEEAIVAEVRVVRKTMCPEKRRSREEGKVW